MLCGLLYRGISGYRWLTKMMDDLLGRFRREATRADSRPVRIVRNRPSVERPEDAEAARAEALCDWAATRACRETFIPYLQASIMKLDTDMAVNASVYPEETIRVLLGERRTLQRLLTEFKSWAGQAGPPLAPVEEE